MNAEHGPIVLALDDLLCSPDRADAIARARAALPTGLLEQFTAAVRENLDAPAPPRPQASSALTPEMRALLPQLGTPVSTGLTPELRALLPGLAAKLGAGAPLVRTEAQDFAAIPGWVRLGIIGALVNYVSGTGLTCEHAPSPERPGRVFACAWRPDTFTCLECAQSLFPVPDSEADHTCDECGRVTTPGDRDGGIRVTTQYVGPLSFSYGRCGDCFAASGGASR